MYVFTFLLLPLLTQRRWPALSLPWPTSLGIVYQNKKHFRCGVGMSTTLDDAASRQCFGYCTQTTPAIWHMCLQMTHCLRSRNPHPSHHGCSACVWRGSVQTQRCCGAKCFVSSLSFEMASATALLPLDCMAGVGSSSTSFIMSLSSEIGEARAYLRYLSATSTTAADPVWQGKVDSLSTLAAAVEASMICLRKCDDKLSRVLQDL